MKTVRSYDVIKSPVITEKSTLVSEHNQVVFKVADDATKVEIKKAVEELFNVRVEAVNTVKIKGKVKRFRGQVGQRAGVKKAYVTLAEGETLDVSTGI